nr:ORF9 [Bracoviriform inaniti]
MEVFDLSRPQYPMLPNKIKSQKNNGYIIRTIVLMILILQLLITYLTWQTFQKMDTNKKGFNADLQITITENHGKPEEVKETFQRIPMFCDFTVLNQGSGCFTSVIIDCIEKVSSSVENVSFIMHFYVNAKFKS